MYRKEDLWILIGDLTGCQLAKTEIQSSAEELKNNQADQFFIPLPDAPNPALAEVIKLRLTEAFKNNYKL